VFEHNALDILSLACLTGVVPYAFRNPQGLRNGAEMVGLARWLRNEGRLEEAAELMRESLRRKMSESLVWDTLWQLADVERKLGRQDAALAAWSELSTGNNPWRAQAYERLAVHYEHREKNYGMALEMTRAALQLGEDAGLRKREARLARRAGGGRTGRLL
jgi:tetratricopeptide (TPR) repeat protein